MRQGVVVFWGGVERHEGVVDAGVMFVILMPCCVVVLCWSARRPCLDPGPCRSGLCGCVARAVAVRGNEMAHASPFMCYCSHMRCTALCGCIRYSLHAAQYRRGMCAAAVWQRTAAARDAAASAGEGCRSCSRAAVQVGAACRRVTLRSDISCVGCFGLIQVHCG